MEQVLKKRNTINNMNMLTNNHSNNINDNGFKILFNGRKVHCIICNEKQKENSSEKKLSKKKSLYN
jgi:hypothetical protein